MSLFPHNRHGGLFVKAPLGVSADCLVRWGNEEKVGRRTTAEAQRVPLAQALALLSETNFNPDRAILVPLAGGWTAFFDNHSHEFTPAAEMYILSERLKTDAWWFYYDDRESSPHRGSAQFILERRGLPAEQRYVSATHEQHWSFEERVRLAFERADLYAHPRKRDRLKPDVLREYAGALGLPFADERAYGENIVLLRWSDAPVPPIESTMNKLLRIFGRPRLVAGGMPRARDPRTG